MPKPLPVHPPLAARIDQPVAHQRLRNVSPARALARRRQAIAPEAIQPELLIEMAGQPAGAPLPRRVKLHRAEPDLHAMASGMVRNTAIGREQRQLRALLSFLVKGFDDPTPAFALPLVDLPTIHPRPLPPL